MVGVGLVVANCGATSSKLASKVDPKYGVSASPRVVAFGEPVPKGGGAYRVGKPYQVAGRTYVPQENTRYRSEGVASWYGDDFHGRLTANGEVFDMESIAAAHPTLPMPSYVRVTNLDNRKSMIVRVNDRGPYHSDRVIDVSQRAADLLGFKGRGTARVRVEYVGRAPLEGSDDRKLIATLRNDGSSPMPVNSGVMVASNGALPTSYSAASRPMAGNVPMPPDRPFDLGEGTGVASAEPVQRTQSVAVVAPAPRAVAAAPLPTISTQRPAQVATAGMLPASRPTAAKPRPVAQAPMPAALAPVAQAPIAQAPARPVRVASAPAATAPATVPLAATGWMVGPQPVNTAPSGIVTPVGTGRGLY
ncbi:MAG: rare lipoprotein [Xanthobacteraceae bacterium]|nr:rare lipoprotein [Xanthobacteraceae bacterium]